MQYPYEEMVQRILRSYKKIPEPGYPNSTRDEVWDAYLHFFSDAYHLKDWITNDDQLRPKITVEEMDKFIETFPNMKLLQTIVTKAKHLKADRSHIQFRDASVSWDDGSPRPSPAIGYEDNGFLLTEEDGYLLNENGDKIEIGGHKQEIHPRDLAIKVLFIWNKFFVDNKLKGRFSIEKG